MAFEALWEDGESFRYLALNAGGLGTQGTLRSVLSGDEPDYRAGRSTAVFPGDSLQRYTTVVGPPLPLSDLDEVRLPASYLDTLKQYERLNLARRPLTQTQANELAAFRLLQGWRRTYGIAITPLP